MIKYPIDPQLLVSPFWKCCYFDNWGQIDLKRWRWSPSICSYYVFKQEDEWHWLSPPLLQQQLQIDKHRKVHDEITLFRQYCHFDNLGSIDLVWSFNGCCYFGMFRSIAMKPWRGTTSICCCYVYRRQAIYWFSPFHVSCACEIIIIIIHITVHVTPPRKSIEQLDNRQWWTLKIRSAGKWNEIV